MKVIVLASQKGGVGKTTIAGHLGVAAEAANYGPVALIDTDPQGSLSAWWNVRNESTPALATVNVQDLSSSLSELAKKRCKLVIIDTQPSVTATIARIVKAADLVLIPTRPSPHDLRAVGTTVELVERAGKKMVFILNGAAARAKITGEAAIALSQHGTVCPVTLYQRTDYAASMTDGRTVQEIDPSSRSASEVLALWDYVAKQLKTVKTTHG